MEENVPGRKFYPFDRSLDTHISRLRRKLGDKGPMMTASRQFVELDIRMRLPMAQSERGKRLNAISEEDLPLET